MSKISEAKKKQGYNQRPLIKRCRVCEHFKSDLTINKRGWVTEEYLRCSIGEFAVKPNAICDYFRRK